MSRVTFTILRVIIFSLTAHFQVFYYSYTTTTIHSLIKLMGWDGANPS